jgi:hypothetical protein
MLDYGTFFLVKKIKISQHYNNDYGDYRDYTFLDVNGKKPPNWLHMQSRQFKKSFLRIYSPSMPSTKPGREIEIPDGHKICGIALEMDSKGFVTWADFKTWNPQKND